MGTPKSSFASLRHLGRSPHAFSLLSSSTLGPTYELLPDLLQFQDCSVFSPPLVVKGFLSLPYSAFSEGIQQQNFLALALQAFPPWFPQGSSSRHIHADKVDASEMGLYPNYSPYPTEKLSLDICSVIWQWSICYPLCIGTFIILVWCSVLPCTTKVKGKDIPSTFPRSQGIACDPSSANQMVQPETLILEQVIQERRVRSHGN